MTNAQAAANARKPYADAIKRIEAEKARMQNVINWAARAAKMEIRPDLFAYFTGHVIGELRTLDNGAPLIEPKVQS